MRRGHDPLGERLDLVALDLLRCVPTATGGQKAQHPLDERTHRRPRLGLERWIRDAPEPHRVVDLRPRVGQRDLTREGLARRLRAQQAVEAGDDFGDRRVDDKRVFDHRAHVVVDVDEHRHIARRQVHSERDVLAVTQHVPHLHGPHRADLIQPRQPGREGMPPRGDLPIDTALPHLVAGEPCQHEQERVGRHPRRLAEHDDQLVHARQVDVVVGSLLERRRLVRRRDARQQRAGVDQQVDRMRRGERLGDLGLKHEHSGVGRGLRRLERLRRPTEPEGCAGGRRRARAAPLLRTTVLRATAAHPTTVSRLCRERAGLRYGSSTRGGEGSHGA